MTLSAFIRDDLEARIVRGRELPVRWTLASLAEAYNVSLTPVRIAVGALVASGHLLRETDGRLQANPERVGSAPTRRPTAAPETPDWNARLMGVVIRASLRGEAAFLREEATAEEFGVSRTIVRQEFGRLVGSGLLEHVPRRGWRVVPWSADDTDAFLEIREVLELKALDLARPHLDPVELRRMLEGNQPGEGRKERLDNRLHGYFIECAGNRHVRDFFRTQGRYYTALFDHAAPAAAVVAEMAAQHREILGHLLARRWGLAKAALAAHIRAQKPVLLRLIERLEGERPA